MDQAAFERIAISAAIKAANSLFISVRSLVIDGVETLNTVKKKAPDTDSAAGAAIRIPANKPRK